MLSTVPWVMFLYIRRGLDQAVFSDSTPNPELRSSSSHTLPQGHRSTHPTPVSVSPDGCLGTQWRYFTLGSPCPDPSAQEDAAGSHWGCCWKGVLSGCTYHPGAPHSQGLFKSSGPSEMGISLQFPQRERDKKTWGENRDEREGGRERWRQMRRDRWRERQRQKFRQ